MALKPLRDKVVVERSEAEQRTAGGILLPDTAKDKPKEGVVVAVGPGRVLENGETRALEVKKGDKVLFGGYAGSEVKLDGKEYLILSENEILAVIGGKEFDRTNDGQIEGEDMAAKKILFDQKAREGIRRGVQQLARAVKVTLGPPGPALLLEKKG